MGTRKTKRNIRVNEEKLRSIAKMIKILGYAGSLIFLVAGIYWFTLPGGWLIGVCLLGLSLFIAIEVQRVIKV